MPGIQILDQCWIKGRNTLFIGSGLTVMIRLDPDKFDPDPAQMILDQHK